MKHPMPVDAHFHAWRLDRGDYGWLTPSLAPIYRDVAVSDWQAQAAPHGIGAGVLVQAAPTRAETLQLLAWADAHAAVRGVVGWEDFAAPDAPARIVALARHPRLKGLRPMLQDIAQTDWILQDAVQPALQAMAGAGLVLDALIQPRHLPLMPEVARRHPTLRIVVDHGAKPQHGMAETQWRAPMQALAQATEADRVMCKLSGLWTEAPAGEGVAWTLPWAQALLQIWGPQRLIWGSDWPVLELVGHYSAWREASLQLLAPLDAAARDRVLGGNAWQIYRL
jgi:L-fuconolactonase